MSRESVTERFLRYVKVDTQSSEENSEAGKFPSTDKQHNLAKMLADELKDIGVDDVFYDERYCYVYARIKNNSDNINIPTLAYIAHMDTSPEVSGKDVNPQIIRDYQGNDIVLGEGSLNADLAHRDGGDNAVRYVLSPREFPEIMQYKGQDIITTDGTTLLGADDKAGVAEIMTMADYLVSHPEIKHGDVAICFTPDEEVGAGVDHIDLNRLRADYAYTVDGGGIGELEYENFNAASAVVNITGRNVHPGEAKGKMINAAIVAREYDRRLTDRDRPEYTEGYEGFYHLTEINGCVESAQLKYIIRDHNKQFFESKKRTMNQLAEIMNRELGKELIHVEVKDQYYNMKDKLTDAMFLIDNAKLVMEDLGIKPVISPIRGGTDGARLSYMGLPCPNLCAGGHNFHGRYEFVCIQSMEKIVELLVKLVSF